MNFFAVYVDAIIFRFHNNEIQVRLKKRPHDDPRMPDKLALEGVLIDPSKDATDIEALERLFREKIGLKFTYSEQLTCSANRNRDPNGFSLVMPYLCLVESTIDDQAVWINTLNLISQGESYLPFDHLKLIKMAYEALLNKSSYSSLPLFLINQPFRYSQVRKVFEAVLNKSQHRGVLKNRIYPLLECIETDPLKKRDASLYTRKNNEVYYFKKVSEGFK
jgi:8-oxo-dGTP diphosphatase